MNEIVYSLRETCQILKIGRTKLWKLMKEGEIKSFKYPESNRVYFKKEAIEEFLNTKTIVS